MKSLLAFCLILICVLVPGISQADQISAEDQAINQLVSELSLNTN